MIGTLLLLPKRQLSSAIPLSMVQVLNYQIALPNLYQYLYIKIVPVIMSYLLLQSGVKVKRLNFKSVSEDR
jgi:hypothetical protein